MLRTPEAATRDRRPLARSVTFARLLPHWRKCCGGTGSLSSGWLAAHAKIWIETPLWGLMQCRIEQVLAFELGCVARLLTPHRLQAR